MKKSFITALLCALFIITNAQNPGTLDATFGDNGISRFSISANNMDLPTAVLAQEDGKIITVGKSKFDNLNYSLYVSRQNPDGTLDPIYAQNGIGIYQADLVYLNEAMDAVLAPNGLLYVAGHMFDVDANVNKSFVLCIDEFGFENTLFGDNAYVFSEDGHGIVYSCIDVDSQGRIVVGGYRDDVFFAQRFSADGVLDTSFGEDGLAIMAIGEEAYTQSYAQDIKCVEDDNIVLTGFVTIPSMMGKYDAGVCKIDSNGDLISSFGTNGYIIDIPLGAYTEMALSVDVQPNGNYIIAGHNELYTSSENPYYEAFVMSITKDGEIDTTFGEDGYAKLVPFPDAENNCHSIVVAHDGQIFGTITSYDHGTAANRAYAFNLNPDGSVNEDFAGTGLLPFSFSEPEVKSSEVTLQADGKLLMCGYLYDGNNATEVFVSRINTSVTPQAGTSILTVNVEVIDAVTAKAHIIPNENTVEYHVGVVTQEQYDQLGEEAVVEAIRNDNNPLVGENECIFADLLPDTDYLMIASGVNSDDVWGTTAKVSFKTMPDNIDEYSNDNFVVYPNPASSIINIVSNVNETSVVDIVDVTGRCVKQFEISGNATLDVKDIDKGVYLMIIQHDGNKSIQRIVVE